jgi:hypothetical protein
MIAVALAVALVVTVVLLAGTVYEWFKDRGKVEHALWTMLLATAGVLAVLMLLEAWLREIGVAR